MNKQLLAIQRNELTEYWIYKKIAGIVKEPHNRAIIERLAAQEYQHHELWRSITGQEVKPNTLHIWFYYLVTRLLGLSFGLKLMEKGEKLAIGLYERLQSDYPQIATMLRDEQDHEQAILGMIDNRALANVSAMILGLNDAIVEITGALAGLTLALGTTSLIARVALITGLAASLSMAISSYLSAEAEPEKKEKSIRLGLTTGAAYSIAVVLLVIPYFFIANVFTALTASLVTAVIIIIAFNGYTSVSRQEPFGKKTVQMLVLSLGAATINFGLGFVVKRYFGV